MAEIGQVLDHKDIKFSNSILNLDVALAENPNDELREQYPGLFFMEQMPEVSQVTYDLLPDRKIKIVVTSKDQLQIDYVLREPSDQDCLGQMTQVDKLRQEKMLVAESCMVTSLVNSKSEDLVSLLGENGITFAIKTRPQNLQNIPSSFLGINYDITQDDAFIRTSYIYGGGSTNPYEQNPKDHGGAEAFAVSKTIATPLPIGLISLGVAAHEAGHCIRSETIIKRDEEIIELRNQVADAMEEQEKDWDRIESLDNTRDLLETEYMVKDEREAHAIGIPVFVRFAKRFNIPREQIKRVIEFTRFALFPRQKEYDLKYPDSSRNGKGFVKLSNTDQNRYENLQDQAKKLLDQ